MAGQRRTALYLQHTGFEEERKNILGFDVEVRPFLTGEILY